MQQRESNAVRALEFEDMLSDGGPPPLALAPLTPAPNVPRRRAPQTSPAVRPRAMVPAERDWSGLAVAATAVQDRRQRGLAKAVPHPSPEKTHWTSVSEFFGGAGPAAQ
jgi:hypothetical protein